MFISLPIALLAGLAGLVCATLLTGSKTSFTSYRTSPLLNLLATAKTSPSRLH
jgi:hypothetical protein